MKNAWKTVPMGKLCSISSGESDTQDAEADGPYAFFDRSKTIKRSSRFLYDCEALIIPGEGKEFLPKHFEGKFDLHQRAYALFDFVSELDVRFLFYLLHHRSDYFPSVAVGATVKSLRRRHFEYFPVPAPPLAEQQRIVGLLDEAFEGLALAKALTMKSLQLARAIFESHLESVFAQDDRDWTAEKLGDASILNIIDGDRGSNYPSKEDFSDDGFCLFLNTKNVRPDGFNFDTTMFISEAKDKVLRKGKLQRSDRDKLPIHIDVNSDQHFQKIIGFGANISDASAWLINKKLSPVAKQKLLEDLFGPSPGAGFSFTRLTLGASDFSMKHYSLNDMPRGQRDDLLSGFSIDPMKEDVLPVLKAALLVNPSLKVMASPWSAPAWMKTTDSLIKGTLRPDAFGVFARYLDKFADAMSKEGVELHAITLQNEPHFEPDDYPGMRLMPAQRAKLIADHVGPLLSKRTNKLRILDWDHNWDEVQSPLEVLANEKARQFVDGVAWHCYGGDVKSQNLVHDAYPDKETYFTECSGGEWKPHWEETLPWYMSNLIIGTTRGWAKGVLMWNIALDEKYGPHLGGCKDCRGVVTIDSESGNVTKNLDYYALAHASRFVRQGAERIYSSFGTEGIETVAFQNADDHSIALIVLNGASQKRQFSIQYKNKIISHELPAASVMTLTWKDW